MCVEELAERLDLSASTVSHHLKRLESAGLVRKRRDQYYKLYRLTDGWLDRTVRQLVASAADGTADAAERRARAFVDKVVRAFFDGPRLVQMPVQKRKRDVVLDVLAADFEPGRSFTEIEVNEVISRRFEDYCLVRRLLVDRGTMRREAGVYELTARPDTAEVVPAPAPAKPKTRKQRRRELAREYDQQHRVAGIYRITNQETGRFLLGSSVDVRARLNRHRAELSMGSERNPELQADWNALGAERFTFEVLETVEGSLRRPFQVTDALAPLEAEWIGRLRPFDGGAYNTGPSIRL